MYDLLDGRAAVQRSTSGGEAPRQSESVPADDLIGSLYANYCEALESSEALAAVTWERPLDLAVEEAPQIIADFDVQGAGNAITGLISEPETLEEAIGPLVVDSAFDMADLDAAPAPEILQLFASPARPEYAARPTARKAVVPPELVRREHHALAIDSVFPVSRVRPPQPRDGA